MNHLAYDSETNRWTIPLGNTSEAVTTAAVIHARLTRMDPYALCERNGEALLPYGAIVRNLDAHVDPHLDVRPVNCPDCLEWMHA